MTNDKITIIGSGMAGLLAANMLRRHRPVVHEAQAKLPNNHSALLRFRTSAVSDATGIPFKSVFVRKGIWDGAKVVNECTIPLANAYSQRCTGAVTSRSIWGMAPELRYIAPNNFVDQIGRSVYIELGKPFKFQEENQGHVISTIPMPLMMGYTAYPFTPEVFPMREIFTIKATLIGQAVEVYQTIYNGSKSSHPSPWYRATIHGNELTVELTESHSQFPLSEIVEELFGIDYRGATNLSFGSQKFGKISPIDESVRRDFIVWLTEEHGIFSLGRFATWRPLLLDDLVKDIKFIESMLASKADSYTRRQRLHA